MCLHKAITCPFKKLIFFTGHLETCARILVEAKMLNLKVIFPKRLVGAASEKWFELSGNDLIDKMEEISSAMPHNVLDHFENPRSMWDDIPTADRKDFYKDISDERVKALSVILKNNETHAEFANNTSNNTAPLGLRSLI